MQVLHISNALSLGSQLWVVPALTESFWARKIDWYLNFQIYKAKDFSQNDIRPLKVKKKSVVQIPNETKSLNGISNESNSFALDAKVILNPNILPCEGVLSISCYQSGSHSPCDENNHKACLMECWGKKIATYWLSQKKPSLKIFLPKGINPQFFIETTEKYFSEPYDIGVVEDHIMER